MRFKLRKNLGPTGARLLEHGLSSIERILPHTECVKWDETDGTPTGAKWISKQRKELRFNLKVMTRSITGTLRRRSLPCGAGAISRTLSTSERQICERILSRLSALLENCATYQDESLSAIIAAFDENVVADHLAHRFRLDFDLRQLFSDLHRLAEQTYENKALTFACIVSAEDDASPAGNAVFPTDYLKRKRFRVMSDGFYTTYLISGKGALLRYASLSGLKASSYGKKFYPHWCRDLSDASRGSKLGICLTRNGDVLVLYEGSLRFTYRFGQWQYWNHTHLVDLLRNAARVQRVPTQVIPRVVNAVYRASLDVSFRRTGGLFIILKNRNHIRKIVRDGDAIGDTKRCVFDQEFDRALHEAKIQTLERPRIAEIASLDGAVVLGNSGEVLAYGAVVEPRRKGRIQAVEGSRTKAAIGASYYGLSVKVSSDGDITVFTKGKEFIKV